MPANLENSAVATGLKRSVFILILKNVQTMVQLHSFNGNPLQCSCLENPRDGGASWAAVYGVAQSQTQLKRISSSSSIHIQFIYVIQNLDSVLKSRDIILPTQVPIVEAMVFPVMYGCES